MYWKSPFWCNKTSFNVSQLNNEKISQKNVSFQLKCYSYYNQKIYHNFIVYARLNKEMYINISGRTMSS